MKIREVKKQDLIRIAVLGLILAVCAFFLFDQNLSNLISTENIEGLYRPVRELTEFAEGKYYFAILILILSGSFILKRVRLKGDKFKDQWIFINRWAYHALISMLGAGITLQLFKHIIGRYRPHVTEELNPYLFDHFTTNWHHHSFPSGHAQTAFTFATILWITFPRMGKWIFLIAGVLALTRLPLEEHFSSDVICGSLLGFFAVILIQFKLGRLKVISS